MNYPDDFANHLLGVGGIVIHNNRVLLIKPNYGRNSDFYMIPGGFIEPGETFEEAVIREVKEETGIDVEPLGLVSIRSMVREPHLVTDVYCTLLCKLADDNTDIVPQVSEVKLASWLDLDEIDESKDVSVITKITIAKALKYKPLLKDKGISKERKQKFNIAKYEQYWIGQHL